MNSYTVDVLSQPAFLRAALDHYSSAALQEIRPTKFDHIRMGPGSQR